MARIKIDGFLEHLDREIRQAIEAALMEVTPGAAVDAYAVHRAFKRALARKCSSWERIPDRYLKPD